MTAYLNGEFLPLGEARVSVLDRGFLFGDGVYEVIPVYARRPFRVAAHLARLAHSLAGIRLANPLPDEEWAALIAELIARQPFDDQALYLQITRGVARRDHLFPRDTPPTIFMMSNPLPLLPEALLEQGVAAVTARDERWHHCDLKTISLVGNVLLRQFAADQGASETLLFRDGMLTEGAATNVLIVKAGVILAPPQDWRILPGITYGAVRELALAHGLPFEARPIAEAEVRQADEIWLASSLREVLAVTRLDGQAVGSGKPGPVWRRMRQLFLSAR